MSFRWRRLGMSALLIAGLSLTGIGSAHGQMKGRGRSLGGYGGATIGSYYRNSQGVLLPYGGAFGGYIPYQSLEPRTASATLQPREIMETPIGGTGMMRGTPIGGSSLRRGTFLYVPLRSRGGMMGQGGRRSRTLPGFGYPFRRPPLLSGSM